MRPFAFPATPPAPPAIPREQGPARRVLAGTDAAARWFGRVALVIAASALCAALLAPAALAARPAAAAVVAAFLAAFQRQPSGADALQYLAASIQERVRAGQSVAAILGLQPGYRSFAAAPTPVGTGAGHRGVLATLSYGGPVHILFDVVNTNPAGAPVWKILGARPASPAEAAATPRIPQAPPSAGGGGGGGRASDAALAIALALALLGTGAATRRQGGR